MEHSLKYSIGRATSKSQEVQEVGIFQTMFSDDCDIKLEVNKMFRQINLTTHLKRQIPWKIHIRKI